MGSRAAALTIFCGTLFFASSLPTRAFAQQLSASDRETARALMAEGREKRDAGDLPGALKAFNAADSIMHVPTTGLEVARTQEKMGNLVEARETLLAVLRIPAQPNDPAPFAEARKAAETLDADLARRIPSLVVEATTDLGGPISVSIDDQTIAPNLVGIPRKLNPGKHVVVAKAAGEEARETVTLAHFDNKRVTLRVVKKVAPKVEPKTETPPEQEEPSADGKKPVPLISWVGFGVGAAGLAVGSVAGILSLSKTSDATKDCVGNECPRSAQPDLDSANTLATVSNVGFAIAIVGAAVGVVGLFVLRPAPEPKAASARITFTPAGVAGTF